MFGSFLSPTLAQFLATQQGSTAAPPPQVDPLSPLPDQTPALAPPTPFDAPNQGINSVGRPSDVANDQTAALKKLSRQRGGEALMAMGAELLSARNFGEGLGKGILAYQQTLRSLRPSSTTIGDGAYEKVTDPLTGQSTYRATPVLADKRAERGKPVVAGSHVYQLGMDANGAYDGTAKDLAPSHLEKQVVKDAAGNETVVFVDTDTGSVYDPKGTQISGPTNGGAPTPPQAPAPGGDIHAITANTESRTHDLNPDGSPVTSSKGARFAMQVLPTTAHDPGFGVAPAANDTASEYDRVGNQLLDKFQGRYGGDMTKAWAAYNWGPGRVDRATAKYGNDWLSHAPSDVQRYVAKNMAALGNSPPTAAGTQVASNDPSYYPGTQAPADATQAPPPNQWGLQPHSFAPGAPAVRYLNSDEKKAAGYPVDSVVQRTAKGADVVLEKGTAPGTAVPDSAVNMEAETFRRTGKMPPMGLNNAVFRNAIMTKAAELNAAEGITGPQASAAQVAYNADVKALTTRTQQLSYMRPAIGTALAHGKEALNLATQVPGQTNVKLWNYVSQGILDQNSNPTLYALQSAAKQAEAEVAKVITGNPNSGSGQLTDDARREFRVLEGPYGIGAKQQAWATIVRLMNEKIASVSTEVHQLNARTQGPLSAYVNGGDPSPQPAAHQAPKPGTVVRGWTFHGGNPADKNNWSK